MASEKERVAKLENRAKEADIALQQLKSYVELLRKKSAEVPSAEASKLEAENAELKKEVFRLKQELILEEIRNGVEQYPVPNGIFSTPRAHQAPPTVSAAPTPLATTNQPQKTTPTPSTGSTQPKKTKVTKAEKKKDGGSSSTPTPGPVDVSRLDMRVGRIVKAWKHPDADGLYVEEVDVGEGGRIRTVCSGLVNHVPLEQMQDRLGVFLCNLKTAKMRGVPSEAMVMCASTPEKVEILDPPAGSVPGDRVVCVGFEGSPDAQLNPKKKIFEAIQPHLHTNEECVACFRDVPFTIAGKDLGHEPNDVIPLPNVNSSILRRVLGWAEHSVREGLDSHQQTPPLPSPPSASQTPVTVATPTTASTSGSSYMPFQPRPHPRIPQRTSSRRLLPPPSHTLSAWEKEFLTRNKDNIYELLLAANYLDIKSLLDVLCRVVADMIKGRDPQDIRRVFHAPNPSGGWVVQEDMPSSIRSSLSDYRDSHQSDSNYSFNSRPNED